jgi:hypothetical protein
MESIFGGLTTPSRNHRPHVQGRLAPPDEYPELTAELIEEKLRAKQNTPNTGKPLEKDREWKRIDYIAPRRPHPSNHAQLPDYAVTVLDEEKREEHRFYLHRHLLNAQSRFFLAAQKPIYGVCIRHSLL